MSREEGMEEEDERLREERMDGGSEAEIKEGGTG